MCPSHLKGKVLLVSKLARGDPPANLTLTNLSWRIFGVIQNPSGFGVFRPVLRRGFKGFSWNSVISQKSLLKVENWVVILAFWLIFIYALMTLPGPYPLKKAILAVLNHDFFFLKNHIWIWIVEDLSYPAVLFVFEGIRYPLWFCKKPKVFRASGRPARARDVHFSAPWFGRF